VDAAAALPADAGHRSAVERHGGPVAGAGLRQDHHVRLGGGILRLRPLDRRELRGRGPVGSPGLVGAPVS
jgi:hypothetical protein